MSRANRPTSPDALYDPDNVIALLERATYLEGDVERTTERRRQRQRELAEDAQYLEYEARVAKSRHAANVKDSLQPFSAEAASNADSILAMLRGSDPVEGQTGRGGAGVAHEASFSASRTGRQLELSADGDALDDEDGDAFTVDTELATEKHGGKAPPEPPRSRGGAGAIDADAFRYDDDEEDDDEDKPSSATRRSAADVWDAKAQQGAIGRRKIHSAPRADKTKRNEDLQQSMNALLAPPPATATYAHEIAHIFNMLDSNNIVLVATEEMPPTTVDAKPEYKNKLCVLSPTNGMRLRVHLDTPEGEPRLMYTSHGWAVRQSLLSAILQGRIDLEYVSRLQQQLETTFVDLKRHQSLLQGRDAALTRERKRYEYLMRSTETLVGRNRLRRAFLVQMAFALKSAHRERVEELAMDPGKPTAAATRSRGAYLADFILRQDTEASAEEAAVVGSPDGLGGSVAKPSDGGNFSSFEELQAAVSAFEEARAKNPAAADQWGAVTSTDLNSGYGLQSSGQPGVSVTGGGMELSINSMSMPDAGGTAASGVPRSIMASLVGQQSHEALLHRLQRKVDAAIRRRNFERRMEAMERAALEGEDSISAVNTVFRLGESGFCRVRDILKSVPADTLRSIMQQGSALNHAPLVDEGKLVVCPCCKFEFDPSKSAASYREAILARQRKAREAMAAKTTAAAAASPNGGGGGGGKGRSGMKSVNPGNMAATGGAESPAAGSTGAAETSKTPRKGGRKGKGQASDTPPPPPASEGDVYAIMALQETVDELNRAKRDLELKCESLEAEAEVARLNVAATQQKAETMNQELLAEKKELEEERDEALVAAKKHEGRAAAATTETKQVRVRLAQLEKASEEAFEELENLQQTERHVLAEHSMLKMEKAAGDGKLAWEEMGRVYYRKYQHVCKQLAKLKGEAVDMIDVYCGEDSEMRDTTDYGMQWCLADANLDLTDVMTDVEIQMAPLTRERGAGTPRPALTYADVGVGTSGVQILKHTQLKTEKQAALSDDWKDSAGEDVHTVVMRKDIYATLLRASDFSDFMRERIRELEQHDKLEAERHEKETTALKKAHERESKLAVEQLAARSAALEAATKDLRERSEQLKQQESLNNLLKEEVTKLRSDPPRGPTPEAKILRVPMTPPAMVGNDTQTSVPPSAGDRAGTAESLPGVDEGEPDVPIPYEQIYRPTGVGRTVVRRVHARTTADVEEDEASMRQRLEELYSAFTIPLPMLLALMCNVKVEVREIVADHERRGRQRETRIREAVGMAELLVGEGLGVSRSLPRWYGDLRSTQGDSSPHVLPGGADDADGAGQRQPGVGYRILQGRELEMPLPSKRNPETGQYDGSRPHGTFVRGATAPSLPLGESLLRQGGPPPVETEGPHSPGSVRYKSGHVVPTAPPELVLAGLLHRVTSDIAAAHGTSLAEVSDAMAQQQHPDDGSPDGEYYSTPPLLLTKKFETMQRVHHLSVDGHELGDGPASPDGQARAASIDAAHRQRNLDALRHQRENDLRKAAMPRSRDGGAILEAILSGGTGAASSVTYPRGPGGAGATRRPHDLPPLDAETVPAAAAPHQQSPASTQHPRVVSEERDVRPPNAQFAEDSAEDVPAQDAHRIEHMSLSMLRGRGPGPTRGDDSATASPRHHGDGAQRAAEERDAARRVERLANRNASEARRIRGIRTNAGSAPPHVPEPLAPIVAQPPMAGGYMPAASANRSRSPQPQPFVDASGRDVMQHPEGSRTLGLVHGVTGAARGSIAVKMPRRQRRV